MPSVQLWPLAPRLLSILAVVSLVASPMARPSVAATVGHRQMAAVGDVVAMPEGMHCCPDQKPTIPDCRQSCPLAVLCMAICFPIGPTTSAFIPARFALTDVKALDDDTWRVLLPDPPPPKPPRA
jgi:hypothetical protein